jgi:arylsulfatase A-like enzyme
LSCFGSTFYESPNIDRLATEGVKFTQAYSAGTVCSPTRASIVTGQYPIRTGCTQWGWGIRGTEYCFGQALIEAGYSTFFAGKWHIGNKTPKAAGFAAGGEMKSKGKDDPKGTREISKATVEFIKGAKGKPFFAYVNYHAVHTPLTERQDVVAMFTAKKDTNPPRSAGPSGLEKERNRDNKQVQDNEKFAAMVKVMDDSVREILDTVESIGASDNTIVLFFSDNGGLSTKPCTSNLPLRAGKGWIYEGGIRVPMIVKWPGVTKPNTACDVPVISTDFFPTILEMANLPLRPKDHCDGVSLAGMLRTGTPPERKALYWHYPHHHGAGCSPCGAIRVGDFKLVQFFEEESIELYNLNSDLSELKDLALTMPEKKEELLTMLKAWQASFPAIKYGETKKKRGQRKKEK